MPELTDNQIADLHVLQSHSVALGGELVVIGAIAYQIHFPEEARHTGDIDFAVALDLDEFAELERRLLSEALSVAKELRIEAPVMLGRVVAENLAGTGVSLIATRAVERA